MKLLFSERMARWVAVALLIHGAIVVWVGYGQYEFARTFNLHPEGEDNERIIAATVGSTAAMVAGAAIVVLSVVRLSMRFDFVVAKTVVHDFLRWLAVEAVFVVIGGMFLDGGLILNGVMRLCLFLNLFLLGTFEDQSTLDVRKER